MIFRSLVAPSALLTPLLLLSLPLGCGGGDGDGPNGDGDGDGSSGGSATGGGATGGSGTGGGTGGGEPGTSGDATGGSGASTSAVDEMLTDAFNSCVLLDMAMMVKFSEDNFTAALDGRVVDGSLAMDGGDEVLQQESIAGHKVELRWGPGVADGDQVSVSGWVEQSRQSGENRYRCFDGQVRVRVDDRGDVFYVFASDTLYEASADGTCGAATSGEEAYGCLPDDY